MPRSKKGGSQRKGGQPRQSKSAGGGVLERMVDRLDPSGLVRQIMPGGGEVFRGDIATRALKTLGARAMTVDRHIIVADDFNPNDPDDMALFAHEQHHAKHGDGEGGGGGHNFRDAEEVAARAAERITREVHKRADPDTQSQGTGHTDSPELRAALAKQISNAAKGYHQMMEQGHSRAEIVEELARHVNNALDERAALLDERHGRKKNWSQ